MRKYRNNLEIIADILKAANDSRTKSRIMYLANQNFYQMNKYLQKMLYEEFLCIRNEDYGITEKGKKFLEKYDAFQNRYLEAQDLLKDLSIERKALEDTLLNKVVGEDSEGQKEEDLHNEGWLINTNFKRINPGQFYDELKNLGFKPDIAAEIISWINVISKSRPTFFSGKKTDVIKACLACNAARIFGSSQNVTRRSIALAFGSSPSSIQRSYKDYLLILQKEKPDLFKS